MLVFKKRSEPYLRLGPPAIGGGGIYEMLHLPTNAATDVGTAPSSLRSKRHTLTPVLNSEHWRATRLVAAIGHIHIGLPAPRPHYPHREASYFESARMSRHMDHL